MMRKKLPVDRAMGAQKSMERPQWRVSAMALATAVLLGLSASDASALALGRVTVQSALGEPLRADIDLPEINAEELSSLRTVVASPEAFRAAGFEYHPAIANIQITLQRRPDGRHFLRLSSQRAVNDPFVDLILEASWSSGRIVRDYTMLFDPPSLRQSAPAVPAQVPPEGAPRASATATPPAAPVAPAARAPVQSQPVAQAPATAASGAKQVTVQSGETAGRIATANKPPSVSLDQMLIAMLRANPEAFIDGNVNRLKAGAVLAMPTAEQAELVGAGEARQNIIAQSRDFNTFRRRLAESLPTTRVDAGERLASGRVQAQVEEKKATAAAPDKLTLSKGAVQGKGAADQIARDRAARDDATRLAELNKNISELNKLGSTTNAPASAGGASGAKSGITLPPGVAGAAKPASSAPMASASAANAASAPAAVAASTPASAAASATAVAPELAASDPAAAASAPEAAAAATAAASAASSTQSAAPAADGAAIPAPKAKPVAPPAPVETSMVEDLLENPIVPATVGGVLALLLGFGFYRARQRKKSTQVDSSFLESRLQPDSFFGASGGQRIDTNEANATGSSMVYSPSQLDAAGDVDPVAEADVYLAYGRDLQAEEILKEAMRTTPQRVAVHSKLLEIYSKRRDAKSFELVATEAYGLTQGVGPEWEHICELGKALDPSNTLYGAASLPVAAPVAASASKPTFNPAAAQALPVADRTEIPVDLDLDLDFSLGEEAPPAPPTAARAAAPQPTQARQPAAPEPMPSLDMDFGSAPTAPQQLRAAPQPEPARATAPTPLAPEPPKASAPAATPAADAGMIEFDMGALSLDLGSSPAAAQSAGKPEDDDGPTSTAGAPLSTAGLDVNGDDPLATKLALAQEFNAIGDPDGARSLAQEVLAEASGDLKHKAQRFLAEIA